MLVDSHCHLDFPDFAASSTRWWRARAPPASGAWSPSRTRVRKHAQVLAIAEKFPDVFCSVGTHPHNAHEELDIDAKALIALDAKIPKSWRSARPASIITTTTPARRAGARLAPTHCRGTRNRAAAGDPFARLRRRHGAHSGGRNGEGRLPGRAALLHRRPRFGVRAIELGHYVSFTGILTFKNSQSLRDIAAALPADRILVETDAPYLAPLPYRGKRNEPAYVVETAKVLAQTRGVSADEIARADHGEFLPPVQQSAARSGWRRMSLTFTILGCGSSMGVPRVALGWGACDPNNPKNRRRRCALLVERGRCRRRRHARSGRLHAGFARAIARRRSRLARRRAHHPRACRPHPRHRRSAAAVRAQAPARECLARRADLARHARPLRLLLHDAARQRISADPDRAPAGARAAR